MPQTTVIATVAAVFIGLIVLRTLYQIFDHVLPSSRTNPPVSDFDLVSISEPLNNPNTVGDGLDLILVHGLGSHPDRTWLARETKKKATASSTIHNLYFRSQQVSQIGEEQYVDWVRKYLISDLADQCGADIRIYLYNYDSAYSRDAPAKRLRDLGNQLLAKITSRKLSATKVRTLSALCLRPLCKISLNLLHG